MERLSSALGTFLAAQLQLDDDRREQVSYGAFVFLQSCMVLGSVIIVSAWLGVLPFAVVIALTAATLRAISGGAHLHGSLICTVISVGVFCGGSLLAKMSAESFTSMPLWGRLAVTLFLTGIAFIAFYLWAPVDSKNLRLSSERRVQLRISSMRLAALYAIVCVLLSFSGSWPAVAIITGMWLQAFTLTPAGHSCANIIDSLGVQNKGGDI